MQSEQQQNNKKKMHRALEKVGYHKLQQHMCNGIKELEER